MVIKKATREKEEEEGINEEELQKNCITCRCGDEMEEMEMEVWRWGGCGDGDYGVEKALEKMGCSLRFQKKKKIDAVQLKK